MRRNPQQEYSDILSLFYYGEPYDYLSDGQKKILYFDWAPIIEQEMLKQKPIDSGAFYLKYRLKMMLTPLITPEGTW